jgi:hypothetical protein
MNYDVNSCWSWGGCVNSQNRAFLVGERSISASESECDMMPLGIFGAVFGDNLQNDKTTYT